MPTNLTVSEASSADLPGRHWMDPGARWAWVLSFVLHGVILYFMPEQILPQAEQLAMVKPKTLELVLEPEIIKPKDRRFAEANTDVPDNIPDEKQNYSYRNQQAAEENPFPLSQKNQPRVDGTEQSQKILEGQFKQTPNKAQQSINPIVQNPKVPETPVLLPPRGKAQAEFIKEAAIDKMGAKGSKPFKDHSADTSGALEGAMHIYETKAQEQAESLPLNGVPTQAKPRPRIDPKLLVGPLLQSTERASKRGKLAINACFSEFGEYEQQFYAAVVSAWYQDIDYYQPIDLEARVQVRFTMQADGTVTDVKATQSTATEIATIICENAISQRKKFRAWTKEMVEVYGENREMTVVFIYR